MWEIETKYSVGDKVWVISDNKAVNRIVTQFDIIVKETNDNPEIEITYELNFESDNITEDKLFKSKEELLKSL